MGPGVVLCAVAVWIKGLMHNNSVTTPINLFILLTFCWIRSPQFYTQKAADYTT
jgi:hypothetical protein